MLVAMLVSWKIPLGALKVVVGHIAEPYPTINAQRRSNKEYSFVDESSRVTQAAPP
jgi:rRNA processing protein Gar1